MTPRLTSGRAVLRWVLRRMRPGTWCRGTSCGDGRICVGEWINTSPSSNYVKGLAFTRLESCIGEFVTAWNDRSTYAQVRAGLRRAAK